jgi:cyclophilin family peptidyl-prolyl cis-trans isomerase
LKQLTDTFPNDVRFIYRNFPLTSIHDKASLSAQAAEAANLQGKYWEMHEALFDGEKWNAWASMSADDFKTWLIQEATALGLDVTKFTTDLTSDAVVNKVKADETTAQSTGLGGTPAFFILLDDQLIFTPDDQLYHDFATHQAILTLWKFEKQKYTECPQVSIDTNKQYTATIKTSKGDVVVELYAKAAPLTVNSFVFLADNGWFNNIPWHRVIDGFVAQSGDPSGTGMGGPGYEFGDEISADLNFDTEGVVGMANSGSGTNGSQFFITLAAASDLNGRYTIFGKVLSGMDVLKSLTKVDPTQANQPTPDSIISITISEQ